MRPCCRRAIASMTAFENAMTLDIAMGGSTNTVLHLLAAAYEGEVPFTMADIDRLSRRVPVLCKVAPAVANVHMEDVHRAGGIMAIPGELDRAGLIDTNVGNVGSGTLKEALARWDVAPHHQRERARVLPRGPRRHPDPGRLQPGLRFDELDLDREGGVVVAIQPTPIRRMVASRCSTATCGGRLHREDRRGGRQHPQLLRPGPRLREPGRGGRRHLGRQGQGRRGVLIRYEGPRGGPGMQEMLYPTSYLKSKGLGKACALVTDGRFSGGSSGLSIGHVSPEAAKAG